MPEIQIKEIDKSVFSLVKRDDELLHIANTNQYHIIFFNEDGECEINFEPYEVKSNYVLFLSPSDVFICRKKENKIFQLSFSDAVFDTYDFETQALINGALFNNLINDPFLKLSKKEAFRTELDIKKIIEFQVALNYKKLKIVFEEFITECIVRKHKQVFSETIISKDHQVTYSYFSLINKKFSIEHSVSEYARALSVQPKTLTKVFFDLKIRNPKNYLNKIILNTIKKILTYGSNRSTEISYETGFNDPAYFARFFKKNTGLTPKKFRKNQRYINSMH